MRVTRRSPARRPTSRRSKGVIRLSRFRFVDGEVVNSTEQQILDVPVDRGICCHVGGDIVFDSDGNLLLSTGDDTNPFFSDGYTPIDERPTQNPAFDAQRSAGNTNDLRGKVLRIRPKAGGGYRIPAGNLFRRNAADARPEIYAMGLRNPFRIEVDPTTDALYVADYSPDANEPDPARGPAGHGKWTAITEPGNYGWPYCATAELPYVDYDFATASPATSSTVRVRSTARRTTPDASGCLRSYSRTSGTPTASPRSSRSWGRAASVRWPGRRTTSTRSDRRGPQPVGVAALLRRHAAALRVDP